jgi:hypothetical protein
MFMCSDRVDHINTTTKHSYQELSPWRAEPENADKGRLPGGATPKYPGFRGFYAVNV